MVDSSFRHGDVRAVEKEVSAIFGKDLVELRSVCSDSMSSSTGEYYMFVRCGDYQSHVDKLMKSAVVVSAVPSFDSPHLFGNAEVDAFDGSARKKEAVRDFVKGDMVLVREGYLKNLFGVVAGKVGPRKYKVVFSFHLRKFAENLSVTTLDFVANVLERVRQSRQTGVREVAVHHQLHRQPSRHAEGSARGT
jgi:hypothetical protein